MFTKLKEVSIEQMQRTWHVRRGRLLLRTSGPVHFRIYYIQMLRPVSPILVICRIFENPSVRLFDSQPLWNVTEEYQKKIVFPTLIFEFQTLFFDI